MVWNMRHLSAKVALGFHHCTSAPLVNASLLSEVGHYRWKQYDGLIDYLLRHVAGRRGYRQWVLAPLLYRTYAPRLTALSSLPGKSYEVDNEEGLYPVTSQRLGLSITRSGCAFKSPVTVGDLGTEGVSSTRHPVASKRLIWSDTILRGDTISSFAPSHISVCDYNENLIRQIHLVTSLHSIHDVSQVFGNNVSQRLMVSSFAELLFQEPYSAIDGLGKDSIVNLAVATT